MEADWQSDERIIYQIKIQGDLEEHWTDWFEGMSITSAPGDPPVTTLTGVLRDQAALRGVLYKLWNLNLKLISVTPVGLDEDLDA